MKLIIQSDRSSKFQIQTFLITRSGIFISTKSDVGCRNNGEVVRKWRKKFSVWGFFHIASSCLQRLHDGFNNIQQIDCHIFMAKTNEDATSSTDSLILWGKWK